MRVTALLFALIIAGISCLSNGQQTAPLQGKISASEILQKNLIATGGPEAHKALETLVASGEVHLNTTQRIGDYKFSYKAPDNHMLEMRTAGHGTTWTGQRGKRGVARSSTDMLAVPEPLDLCKGCVIDGVHNWIMESNWLMLLRGNFCRACNIELIGMGEVDNRLAYALRFTSKKGGDPFVCF